MSIEKMENCADTNHVIEVASNVISEIELNYLDSSLHNYLNSSMNYSLSNVSNLQRHEWKVVSPLLLNSNRSRALAVVSIRAMNDQKNFNNSITWICGFNKENAWYFFRKNETEYIQLDKENHESLTFKEIEEWVLKNEFKGYLKYDEELEKCIINDSFFTRYMDNWNYVQAMEVVENGYDFSDRSESYWTGRYMLFENSRQRLIELIRNEWVRQDKFFENGSITQEEYDNYLRLRSPTSDEDWKKVRDFHKSLTKDSILQSIQDELKGEVPNKLYKSN